MDDDEDEFDLAEATVLSKQSKSVALPFAGLGGLKAQEEEKSHVYQKRYRLFAELGKVPLNIQQSDNIWLLEDFLLKRVKTGEDVKRLVQHTRPAYRSALFNNERDRGSEEATQRFEEIDNPELQELHRRCVDRIAELLDQASNQDMFEQLKPEVLEELSGDIACTCADTDVTEAQLKLFYQALYHLTDLMIKEHEMHGGEGEDSRMDDLGHEEEREHIVQIIIVKMQSFFGMLDTLKNRVRDQMDMLKKEKAEADKDKDVEMKAEEESKGGQKKEAAKGDQQMEAKGLPTQEQAKAGDGGQARTKIQSSALPVIAGDSPVLSLTTSEVGDDSGAAPEKQKPSAAEKVDVEMNEGQTQE